MSIITVNPANGKMINEYAFTTKQEAFQSVEKSWDAFLSWSETDFQNRAKCMEALADILEKDRNIHAHLITAEMGKPLKNALDEIDKCALTCRHFAENAQQYLASRVVETTLSKHYVTCTPMGIIFAIMPWNYPFWQVIRFAAPGLMAGNSILLKHAPNTTGCGLAIERMVREAGFPEHVLQTLLLENDLAEEIIQHPKISALTLTGSHLTGKKVGAIATGALKKTVLELGGNDPYIILEDADLELAAEACITSRMNNAGQSCIAAKRLLAVSAIREEFQDLVEKKMQKYIQGNPMLPEVTIGPLAREDLRTHLHKQVMKSVEMGAKIEMGGEIPNTVGFFYPPTLITNVKKGMPAYGEELFGPVVTFIDVSNEDEAIRIANDTEFGLSGAVFTRDIAKGEYLAVHKIRAGTVFVNDYVRSDPRLPFGGIKHSGFGRELSKEGIHEFVNVKTIGIR